MREQINRANYERFLIDFAEGTLKPDQHALVLLFLEHNPDIAKEFNKLLDIKIEAPEAIFPLKDQLKIKLNTVLLINRENYEHYFIAYHEGDLADDEKIQLEDFINENPDLKKEFLLHKKVRFNAPENTLNKSQYKHIEDINGESFDYFDWEEWCIGYYEGDLEETKKIRLLSLAKQSPELNSLLISYKSIFLSADKQIKMPNKSNLKRKTIAIFLSKNKVWLTSVAAIILLIFSFSIMNKPKTQKDYIAHYPTEIYPSQTFPNENTTKQLTKPLKHNNTISQVANTTHSIEKSNNNTHSITAIPANNISSYKREDSFIHSTPLHHNNNVVAINTVSYTLQTLPIAMAQSFTTTNDGYYLVKAQTRQRLLEKHTPKYIKTIAAKFKRIFYHETEQLKNNPQKSLQTIAQIAITGFNKMTESNLSIGFLNSQHSDKERNKK